MQQTPLVWFHVTKLPRHHDIEHFPVMLANRLEEHVDAIRCVAGHETHLDVLIFQVRQELGHARHALRLLRRDVFDLQDGIHTLEDPIAVVPRLDHREQVTLRDLQRVSHQRVVDDRHRKRPVHVKDDPVVRQFLLPAGCSARPRLWRVGCGGCRVPRAFTVDMSRRRRPAMGQRGHRRVSEARHVQRRRRHVPGAPGAAPCPRHARRHHGQRSTTSDK
mmetsp:Transcript_1155/g.3585  ORF Transcript_1155/g.3585 Transcript_1155/m.3585 type:complete len:219 (-) Transcript_1155:1164-1820(-)